MENFEAMRTVGVKAADGTAFYFSAYDNDEERTKKECKKYEAAAENVVFDRLKDVLVSGNNTIKSIIVKNDGTEEQDGQLNFYFDDDVGRFLGCYEARSYIFTPKTDEDIKNLALYLELKGKCHGTYESNVNKAKVGNTYVVLFSYDDEYYFIGTMEDIQKIFKNVLERETRKLTAFLNPTEYVYRNGDFVKK